MYNYEEYLYNNNIPFIYINASQLAISGFINCIDGNYEICIKCL